MIRKVRVTTRTIKRLTAALALGGVTLAAGVLLHGQGARMGDAVLQTDRRDPARELAMKITAPRSG